MAFDPERLRNAFRRGFSPETWNEILHGVFGAQQIIQAKPIAVPAGEKGAKGWSIGEIDTPDHAKIGLFRYEVRGVKARRVGLRTLVKSWTGGAFPAYDAALVVFADKTSSVWRVSLVCDLADGATAPKRFTYLFGEPSGQYRTPVARFGALAAAGGPVRLDALREAFSVEALCREFYDELFGWYQWALSREARVTFPNDTGTSADDRHNLEEHLIRLVTRLMFVWFIRQKGLVPADMLDPRRLTARLDHFDSQSLDSGNFYNGILQNLFFATLDNPIPERAFATDRRDEHGRAEDFGVKTLYRNPEGASWFKEPNDRIVEWFRQIPFLNGGLFECLDRTKADLGGDGKSHLYVDGFSRNSEKLDGHWRYRAFVPNALFFAPEEPRTFTAGGETAARNVSGLLTLFGRYNFTIEENSPDDAEVALDPELLGKVFENLLGTYNPETRETARKSSGSFYTPREIVAYMVDESLRAYLLGSGVPLAEVDALLSDEDLPAPLASDAPRRKALADILLRLRALDPACGSGAFPMGLLGRMVALLRKLDPAMDRAGTYRAKLGIIKNCLYGVDIQSIAVQICKLRFFISLVCDQNPDLTNPENNYGIDPLPNLETKFVAANTLVGLRTIDRDTLSGLGYDSIEFLRAQVEDIRSRHFSAHTYAEKLELRKADAAVRIRLEKEIAATAAKPDAAKIAQWQKETTALRKTLDELPSTLRKRRTLRCTVTQSTLSLGLPLEPEQARLPLASGTLEEELAAESAVLSRKLAALEAKIAREQAKCPSSEFNQDAAQLAAWDPYDQNASSPFFDPNWMFGLKEGFDIVIGNPPYINFSKNKALNAFYKPMGFETFDSNGDMYCLFYERGWNLLTPTGHLCYITSNKWMRAGYGEKLRKFLAEKTNPETLVDFAGVKIFVAATVDTNILLFQKGTENAGKTLSAIGAPECRNDLSAFVRHKGFPCAFGPSESWVILSPIEQSIKRKIEAVGVPLKDWNISINYGIKTGCNEAFIINEERKKEILSWCKTPSEREKTGELIRPILRGRDIKRYGYDWAGLYLIATHNGIPERHIPRINVNDYPAIKRHLDAYWEQISTRSDQGDTPYNLRSCAYIDDFSNPKVLWAETMRIRKGIDERFPRFSFSSRDIFTDKTCFMATGQDLLFALALLNSKVGYYQLMQTVAMMDNGGYLMQKIYVETIRLPKIKKSEQKRLEKHTITLLDGKGTEDLEEEIDKTISDLFGLTPKERDYLDHIFSRTLVRL